MDTKWKNTAEKWIGFGKENWKSITGLILAATGIFFFWNIIANRSLYPTEMALFLGFDGNLLLGIGMGMMLRERLRKEYADWEPGKEADIEKWEETERSWKRRLTAAGILALLLAFWYLSYLMGGGVWFGYGVYVNYASGYIMIFSVLIQYILCMEVLGRVQRRQLERFMDLLEENVARRLAKALEIEKKSLEKASRSDQLRVDLITNVSHDLKTPLTSIVGYLELIKKEELNDTVRDYVEVISERAEKLKEMIHSLFSLAKASSGNVELHLEKFEVNRLIGQLFADMEDQVQESGLEFVKRLTEENTELVSDNSYFYRICQNLVENALKYSAKGTRVFVKTEVRAKTQEEERRICLEITNTSGYPMDFTKDDIIERFARGDQARSGDGNGLGLAIVSTYTKALGGEFDIRIDCDQFKACLMFPAPERTEEVLTFPES